jgi:hypothetical protein
MKNRKKAATDPAVLSAELERLEQHFATLRDELGTVQPFLKGSVSSYYNVCSSPGCRCKRDPAYRHGPYYQWSTKERGKTVARILKGGTLDEYRDFVDNHRRLKALMSQLQTCSKEILACRVALIELHEREDDGRTDVSEG